MKRLVIILVAILINVLVFANASFDKTVNYQYNNGSVYEGETLYLLPLTGSWYEEYENLSTYQNFKVNSYDDGYGLACENSGMYWQYKYNPNDPRDNKVTGTHKRHIEGHRFYVKKVVQDPKYPHSWTFYLNDLNTGENLKYIYHGSLSEYTLYQAFPFITEKHLNYCKSLVGSKLIYSTKEVYASDLSEIYRNTFETDIRTGKKINYTDSYVKWTIKSVGIDTYYSCIYFIVTDGKQTTKVLYNIQYSDNYEAKGNNTTRVFTEKQWNKLVNKYGELHMSAIMNGDILSDMTIEEKYMAGGRYAARKKDVSYTNLAKQVGSTVVKSTKSVVKEQVSLIKAFGKALTE